MNSIDLNLSIEEANLILEGLGELPYARVFQLIQKIQQQAQQQLNSNGESPQMQDKK